VCCITADPHRKSLTRRQRRTPSTPQKVSPSPSSGRTTRRLQLYMRNFEQGLHKASTSAPPPTSKGDRAPDTVASHGAASFPSSAPSPPQDHGSQAPAASAASARAAPGAGIFDGLHSIPGDLVDLLTKNGDFARTVASFLEDLHETVHLCVFFTAGPITKAVRVCVGGNNGGHVLRGTTSRGLCGLVCPSRTSERGGEGLCVYYCSTAVCVYYCSTYYKAVRVGGGPQTMEDMCYEGLQANLLGLVRNPVL
jgi:hypothetical protein